MENFALVVKCLKDNGVSMLKTLEHPPTKTSEQSAGYRKCELKLGSKAILLKVEGKKSSTLVSGKEFVLAVVPGNCGINSKVLKKALKLKGVRFANQKELQDTTKLKRGSVPPIGFLFNVKTFVDEKVFENKNIWFNAGSLTKSVSISSDDYKKLLKANSSSSNFEVLKFAKVLEKKKEKSEEEKKSSTKEQKPKKEVEESKKEKQEAKKEV